MKYGCIVAVFIVLGCSSSAFAHRLDEYLQATTIAVDRNQIVVQMRLTPGVDVFDKVLAAIDTNGDGLIAAAEQSAYAEKVVGDLSLTIDDLPSSLRLTSFSFPKLEDMKDGLGDIHLSLSANSPASGLVQKLRFTNRHLSALSVYLVNCLVPSDPTVHVDTQTRNYDQSQYELSYTCAAKGVSPPAVLGRANFGAWLEQTGSGSLAGSFIFAGVQHILTGYDHLLFVSALVLAATTLWDLVKVVSAFTIAHTVTLTLAALNIFQLPQQVVEPLISASIVYVAIQNIFWPSRSRGWNRLGAAFFFGLFHGLGFAGGLLEAMHDMQTGQMFLAIVAFSIGVELGHQLIVLPLFALLKFSRRWPNKIAGQEQPLMTLQQTGSAAISIAGLYYVCLALANIF